MAAARFGTEAYLHGTTVVITEAGSGIGKALTPAFLSEGARVPGVDHAPDASAGRDAS